VITNEDDAVAAAHADPRGGTRAVRHAALASVELTLHRQGHRELTLCSSRGACEDGTRQGMPGIEQQPLPES